MKKALITGITGQDGSYLSKILLGKGYEVHGMKRHSSVKNDTRLDRLKLKSEIHKKNFILHDGDMTDTNSITSLISKIRPNEIYNLAAQSHVQVSFDLPEYTANVNALGSLRILEAIRLLKLKNHTKFYQASTSELYGKVLETPQSEETPFYPRSPYGVSKLFAYWICKNYREAYDIFACNGILFNHESPLRGDDFVTQKIVKGVNRIKKGKQDILYLGNLDAKRDWGHAEEYVEGMWRILQQNEPDDFVLATGRTETVRKFVVLAFEQIGIKIIWKGNGVDEVGFDQTTGVELVKIDPYFYRPTEVDLLIGDPTKAYKELGWQAKTSLEELVIDMMKSESVS
ncbi:GDP-mannose 4,6-dehydratase [Alphaproteobacteria bacterium]|nr:GDP-mannose 4,6-dehydratase [Alphaproteobacteria bacterium]